MWLINERDKNGKHSNKYHGNFIPQIPYQLIKRYTKQHDIVLDLFMGSGITFFEYENLNRRFIGFDIPNCDVTNSSKFNVNIQKFISKLQSVKV